MTMTTTAGVATTASGTAPTLAGQLVSRAHSPEAKKVAIRERAVGLWLERDWGAVRDEAAGLGMGLQALGVAPGDHVGLAAANHSSWTAFDIGAQGIGAVTVVLPYLASTEQMAEAARRYSLRVLLVDSHETAFGLLDESGPLPMLSKVVVTEADRLGGADVGEGSGATPVLSISALRELGRGNGSSSVEQWERSAASLDPNGQASIIVTVGADGAWSERRYRHAELMEAGAAAVRSLSLGAGEHIVVIRPLSDPFERALSEAGSLSAGYAVNYPQSGPLLLRDMAEVQPSVLHTDAGMLARLKSDFDSRSAAMAGISARKLVSGLSMAVLAAPGFVVKLFGGSDRLASYVGTVALFVGVALFGGLWGQAKDIKAKAQLAAGLGGGTALTFALLGGPATWSLRGGSLGLMPGLGALLLGPLLKNRLEADVPSVKQLVLRRALRRPASPVAMRPDALRLLRISLGAAFAIALILNNVLRHSATAAVRLLMAVALIAIALFWALRSGLLVLPFLRRLYGMGRVRAVVVADGPLPPDLHSFWSGLGVTLTPTEEHRDA